MKVHQIVYHDLFGRGIIIKSEGDTGILSHSFLVKFDNITTNKTLLDVQTKYGGLVCMEKELILLEDYR
jgi:hypothetical protein